MNAMAQAEGKTLSGTESATDSKPQRGLFVVFEGIDGSGKSTIAKGVYDLLAKEIPGRVVLTAEPSDSWIGDCVRRANSEDLGPATEALLFVADRAEHTKRIEKWLSEGKMVICDRYYASTLAYQGAQLKSIMGAQHAVAWLTLVNEPLIIQPDLTLLLTLRVQTALERLRSRKERTKFEDLDFLMDVDLIYRAVCMEDPSLITIDASRPVVEVIESALKAIRSKFYGREDG